MQTLQRLLLFFLMLSLHISCAAAGTEPWTPAEGPYSDEAASCIYGWIYHNVPSDELPDSTNYRNIRLVKKLVNGTLIWAYSNGNSFDAEAFLQHFSNRNDSVKLLRLQDGGLLFVLDPCCLKISRDTSSPQGRITPGCQSPPYPPHQWYATLFNETSEVTFYFSAVGPFSAGLDARMPFGLDDGSDRATNPWQDEAHMLARL